MNKLHFDIDINAPKQKVWEVMLADKTYREWTAPFHEGSYYQGDWSKGSKMLFLGPDEKGGVGGMVSKIAENRPYEFLSIEHLGEVANGVEDTTSERVKQWAGAHENYTLNETDGVTTLSIDLDSDNSTPEGKQMADMFADMWPKALIKLKAIAER